MNEYYNPYEFAKSQGFSDADADQLAKAGADATNIRRVAIAKWGEDEAALKRGDKPKPDKPALEPDLPPPTKHRHYYRKDGTCACGAVRKAKG